MKKMLLFVFVSCILLQTVTVACSSSLYEMKSPGVANSYTHNVLVEQASNTSNTQCYPIEGYLNRLYSSGENNFFYVTLLEDKNSYAKARMNDLLVTTTPTVVFDNGFMNISGDQGSNAPYLQAINICGERSVANIEVQVDINWQSSSNIDVLVAVTNRESSVYHGQIVVYVTEIHSRWWAGAMPYHYVMMGDFIMNSDTTVASGQSVATMVFGANYGAFQLEKENVMFIISIFNTDTNHVDYTTARGFVTENQPPLTPTIRGETNGMINVPYNYTAQTNDSEYDPISYVFDWGDGTETTTNLTPSGYAVTCSHTWAKIGTYNVRVQAIDEHGFESNWTQLEVTMPMNQPHTFPIMQWFMERFPNAFPFLRFLLK